MPSFKAYEKTCEICGGTFTAHRSDTRRCPNCRVNGTQKMMQRHRSEVKMAKCKQIEREKAQKEEPHHCKFCGAICIRKFCRDCYRKGFNYVYSVTGRTNGWDKKQRVVGAPLQREAPSQSIPKRSAHGTLLEGLK